VKRATAKYLTFVRLAMIQACHQRAEVFGRIGFFAIVLGVFTSLWRAIEGAGMPIAAVPGTLVWYLAATEWIVLSVPMVHLDVQESIRRGDVVCQLGRPISFVGAAMAEGLGALVLRLTVLAGPAFVLAWWFTGVIPPLRAFVAVVPFGLAAAVLLTALHLCIGLLAFWLQDVAPIYWVFQKLMFVLGGLMMPIQLYPDVLQRMASWTPFPSILAGPASFVLSEPAIAANALAIQLFAWTAVVALALYGLSRRAVAALTINGG
jgi:ABC-2 type transport system permease protein